MDEDGFIEWVACSVVDTNEAENTYLVRYDGSDEDVWQPRMYICFKAEDPFLFANRVEESFKQRELAKLQLQILPDLENISLVSGQQGAGVRTELEEAQGQAHGHVPADQRGQH